ncbi:MAG: ankyrin repeat domain-containing protein [Phycisphaerales bacterium]|nr:ankyrin repeat domain-containing protein [Phycisphaerales bacterium]
MGEAPGPFRVAADVDVKKRDDRGRTPLFIVAVGGNSQVAERIGRVDALIAAGADPDAADDLGSTPLIEAAKFGNAIVVKRLAEKGARADVADKGGRTALHFAVLAGDWRPWAAICGLDAPEPSRGAGLGTVMLANFSYPTYTVDVLIGLKAEVDAADAAGWTPLMCAVAAGWYQDDVLRPEWLPHSPRVLEVVTHFEGERLPHEEDPRARCFTAVLTSKLLDVGADPLKKNKAGLTAFALARRRTDGEGKRCAELMLLKLIRDGRERELSELRDEP